MSKKSSSAKWKKRQAADPYVKKAQQEGWRSRAVFKLEELDQKECPVCGISFFEFRNSGRLGCPYDYTHFESDLQPLLKNVHDANTHVGKRPKRATTNADLQAQMIQLRREMDEAVEREDYEKASEIRDELKRIESEGASQSADDESS